MSVHRRGLLDSMGREAYEASRSPTRTEHASASCRPHSGIGHRSTRSRPSDTSDTTGKVQSGRVSKSVSFKPINHKEGWATRDLSKTGALLENESTQGTSHSTTDSEGDSKVSSDFETQLKPSAENTIPLKSCLKAPVPSGCSEPTKKKVCFNKTSEVKFVANPVEVNPGYHYRHDTDSNCYCKKCKREGPREEHSHANTVSLEVLSARLRGGHSKDEDVVEIDKSLLCAKFNAHRMLGEALQGVHSYFLTDLYLSAKSLAMHAKYHSIYDAGQSALELMRYKRRKGTFFKIQESEWCWLDLDDLAPEIRSCEPRTELDVHWEIIEDVQMRGFKLDKRSNKVRTCMERWNAELGGNEKVVIPDDSARPKIGMTATSAPSRMNFDVEEDEAGKLDPTVRVRPAVKNLWI
ncbi:hypothetical protein NLU13_1234 [Sarocladium strictum]|uniref:Uncharacterized protein n=1 Tax=Sarocladium strictum TaxID=5046 RepID=A0AA39GQK3_SARSR|nr:hypothetical protein NLU13_1234 [Sarocladium strictum]